ncbi:hypothetical protein HBI26_080170 [Parastagonospora nodorum]|nr:hypothetical protein HBH43_039240 [Parastagonospora nodorum]KAH5196476.1 hypothetical protein HBH76_040710 [Parastagonospora nodorum]KAH5427722.1 hypothetical protein HBI46_032350 [Parastagonospora nodorum]KAH5525757.1 hypothetical protein HBI29_026480 [Parastagonospora nodorum]KAH5601529.1 hypothetical protein HBI26_080170 [Parastagonospora nodorum]
MARFLGLRGDRLTSAISAICGLCFLCYGWAQGVMGGLLTVPAFLEQYPQINIVDENSFHNAWVTGLTVGTWNLGCVVSAVLAIFISDGLGRRKTLLLGITLWAIGELIQVTSYSFAQLIVGRAIAGFGNGFTTSTAPAYQAECVKSHRKGTILMITAGVFVSLGYALSYWSVFGFAYLNNSNAAWRVPIALQISFALPAIAMLFVLPDSPRWLILTGREQEALTVIAALNDDDPDSYEVRDEFLQIKDAILVMVQGSTSKLFSNKDRRGFHRVVLAFFVQVFQQGTGINLVLQYLSWIFLMRMGYAAWMARLLASCSATAYFLASFVTVVGIDRFWGRRSLMIFGASGMSGCMILVTIMQYLWTIKGISAARFASTVFLFVFSIFFAIGWQGMAWLYQVEIVPLRIRGPANALSTLGNWLINFIIVFITPIAFANIGYRTWIIFAVTNFAIVPLVYFFYPETAFRSLEEVDVIFVLADEAPGNPWLNAVRISLDEPLWFGKKGGDRLSFDYANSSWHRKLMGSLNGSGNGSSDEKRGRKDKHSSSSSSDEDHTGSSGSDTVAPPRTQKRNGSESPVDPGMYSNELRDHSPTNIITATLASQHKNDSRRSLRQVLTRSHSSNQRLEQERIAATEHQRVLAMSAMHDGDQSLDDDPIYHEASLGPASLRISRPPSGEVRPYSSDTTSHRAFHHPGVDGRPRTRDSKESLDSGYPGRLRADEIGPTESGTEADEDVDARREELGSRGSRGVARAAGRAF